MRVLPTPSELRCGLDAIVANDEPALRMFLSQRLLIPPDAFFNSWHEDIVSEEPYALYAKELADYLDLDTFDQSTPMFLAAMAGRTSMITIMHYEYYMNLPRGIASWAASNNQFETYRYLTSGQTDLDDVDFEEDAEHFAHVDEAAVTYIKNLMCKKTINEILPFLYNIRKWSIENM